MKTSTYRDGTQSAKPDGNDMTPQHFRTILPILLLYLLCAELVLDV